MWIIDNGTASLNHIPMYHSSDNEYINARDGCILYTGTPKLGVHAANKKYVDDGLSGKVDKYTEASGMRRLYGADRNGNQYMAYLTEIATEILPGWIPTYRGKNDNIPELTAENVGVLVTGTPTRPNDCVTKKYVDMGLDGKVDKVTTAYKVYGTGENGNQEVYPTGWSASSGLFQIMDHTPNGGYNDNGEFNPNLNGTYMVAIPKKPSHATPKKWVEDNFTIYKHIVSFRVDDNMFIDCHFVVYSSQATPFTTTLPNGVYVGWSGDLYNFIISNNNGSIIATKLVWDQIHTKLYLLDDDLFIDSDTVMKL